MDDLIKIEKIDGELRVDSRLISKELGVEPRATIQIINRYKDQLETYGKVPFEMLPSMNSGSSQKEITCLLNEQQSTFLVTLSKNSEQAVALKKCLNDSYHYYKNKSLPALPQTFADALRKYADEVEKNQLLETKIQTDKPLVEFAKNIESSPESIEVGDFAKILCKRGLEIGRNRLFKYMKDDICLHMLIDAQTPYQHAMDSGWLEVEEFPYTDKSEEKRERIAKKVMITGKGQLYIEKKLRENL